MYFLTSSTTTDSPFCLILNFENRWIQQNWQNQLRKYSNSQPAEHECEGGVVVPLSPENVPNKGSTTLEFGYNFSI